MSNNATLDRPQGIDLKNLLETPGYDGEDQPLATRPLEVPDTPMILVDDEPIGDRDELMRWLARNAH